MSNITCPTCGLTSYDCGKAGFKTKREIELEQEITRLTDLNKQYSYLIKQRDSYNKELKKKLDIAVKALKEVIEINASCMDCLAGVPAERALKEIREWSNLD